VSEVLRRVAVGSDMPHETARGVADHLEARGLEVVRCGGVDGADVPWPDIAEQVARLVASGAVQTAVLCCWTGTGVSIAANKVPGVRAALCGDAETARGARRWNDANVLALSLRSTSRAGLTEILDAWFAGRASEDADDTSSIAHITEIECS
jgi:ribose 5-phosphate isomerase B